MENIIHFLGLIVFTAVTADGPVEAILPNLMGDDDIHQHDTFIMFEPGTATTSDATAWPIHTIIQKGGTKWEYVDVRGGTLTLNSTGMKLKEVPPFLPRLNDECCGWMGSLKKEFLTHDDPRYTNAHVVLPYAEDVGWAVSNFRIDTIAKIMTNNPLVITTSVSPGDGTTQALTFAPNAKLVIGNFPLEDIKNGVRIGEHFHVYYRMVHRGFFCGKSDMPSTDKKCNPMAKIQEHYTALQRDPVISVSSQISGADIDCSNSGYP